VLDLRLTDDFHPAIGELLKGFANLWPKFLLYVLGFAASMLAIAMSLVSRGSTLWMFRAGVRRAVAE
jgi:hypothetical protein